MNIIAVFEDGKKESYTIPIRNGEVWSLPTPLKRRGERPVDIIVTGTEEEKEKLAKFPDIDKYIILRLNHYVHPTKGKKFSSVEEFVYSDNQSEGSTIE